MQIRVTLRWLEILDNLEAIPGSKGEFVFHSTVRSGDNTQTIRIPKKGHYSISDNPMENRLRKLNKVLFEGEATGSLSIEIRGEELDPFGKKDHLETYSRSYETPISACIGIHQAGDESGDPESLSNWKLGYEIEAL